jgi:hypothetical protein
VTCEAMGIGSAVWLRNSAPGKIYETSWSDFSRNSLPYCSNAVRKNQLANPSLATHLSECFEFYAIYGVVYFKSRSVLHAAIFFFLSLRCLLYEGRAAGFEPELVKLAALPRYQ